MKNKTNMSKKLKNNKRSAVIREDDRVDIDPAVVKGSILKLKNINFNSGDRKSF